MLQGFFPNFNRYGKTFDSQHTHICSLNRNVCGLPKENRQLRKRLKNTGSRPGDAGNSRTPPLI